MKNARLGVNIDHVATLRQARKSSYPSLLQAAKMSIASGADQITIHLRKDRRHIQDVDVPNIIELCHAENSFLNLEICSDEEMIDKACFYKPDWVCLVPERAEEQTTEGGLNLSIESVYHSIKIAVEKLKLKTPKSKISLFIAPDVKIIDKILSLKVHAVEVHTGDYAHDFPKIDQHLKIMETFSMQLKEKSSGLIGIHAGHGLTVESIIPLLKQGIFEEYNIGHWIICQAVFEGLGNVVDNLKKTISTYPIKN